MFIALEVRVRHIFDIEIIAMETIKFAREFKPPLRQVNKRRIAAAKSRLKKEQNKLPLFSELIAEEQPTPEQHIEKIDIGLLEHERLSRQRVARKWWHCRRILKNMPDDIKEKAIRKWNDSRWLPKKAHYFLDMIHTHFKDYYFADTHQ